MKKIILTTLITFLCGHFATAQSEAEEAKAVKVFLDSIAASYTFQTGQVSLSNGLATLNVPAGWHYLDGKQSDQVLTDLWGNPPGEHSLGMLFPEKYGPMDIDTSTYAFNITWEDMGFVKDDDADDINYNDLLKEIQKDAEETNKERQAAGYEAIAILGWASAPFYDKDKKVLHWAKEIRFGDAEESTLNYDVRVLGRNGVLSMNAIGSIAQLPMVKAAIPTILSSVAYTEGKRYSDFSASSGDKIAAITIGGLVAGKVLAKVGLFAVIAKFGKIIIVALLAGGGAVWRFIMGRRKESEETAFTTNKDEPTSGSSGSEG